MPPRSHLEKQNSLVPGLPGGHMVSVHPLKGLQDSATPTLACDNPTGVYVQNMVKEPGGP